MHIIFFTHPSFLGSQSMPRFAAMLADGMQSRGNQVEMWTPQPKFYKWPVPGSIKKWMGYVDQYIVFPAQVRQKLKSCATGTLFVFTDQALGPWIPLVANRPHVIHCHDFLAQRSALGEISENPTSSSGQKYQGYIRKGYRQGKNFISVSKKTQEDLHRFLQNVPQRSGMVYNGLNQGFQVHNTNEARAAVSQEIGADVSAGYLLHVGGNQWYKNRVGVIEIYNSWRKQYNNALPLLLIGASPNQKLTDACQGSPYKNDIYLLTGRSDTFVKQAYSGALLFLFPSLAEGFGWPIAEAMASGCPVITTGEAPMTEVGGDAAFYIPRRPQGNVQDEWASKAAQSVHELVNLAPEKRLTVIEAGLANAKRFDSEKALNSIEKIYKEIIGNI